MKHLSWDEAWEMVQGADPGERRAHVADCPVCGERLRRCNDLQRALVCALTAGVGATGGDDEALLAALRRELGHPPMVGASVAGAGAGASVGVAGAGAAGVNAAGRRREPFAGAAPSTAPGAKADAGPVRPASKVSTAPIRVSRPGARRWVRAAVGVGAAACVAAGVSWPILQGRLGGRDLASAIAVAIGAGDARDAGSPVQGGAQRTDAGHGGERNGAAVAPSGEERGSAGLPTAAAGAPSGDSVSPSGDASADALPASRRGAGFVTGGAGHTGTADGRGGGTSGSEVSTEQVSTRGTAGHTGSGIVHGNDSDASGAGAGEAGSTTVQKPVGPARVKGQVEVRAADGTPLAGATVTLSAGGRVLASARTQNDGQTPVLAFTAPADPMLTGSDPGAEGPGVAVLTVQLAGYRTAVVYQVGLADGAWIHPVVTLQPAVRANPGRVVPGPVPGAAPAPGWTPSPTLQA
ncbi:carboxypeptidase-like regulatory domain-containing protein [Alicyclobacillus sp.]|uniref:carboxypeptidase-like regulatory domain-containing protein n=1 Tax=Alicyclobacillus sp. TaxID=61169 RepID=UPI0025C3AC85|nr:carboxypeptidase-like regulatory domain-containing protein [Alicyclobacillus sp.]MCL6515687.1 carboxypeptidase-like regulatory domain-containing protein [Alicyclobacillus sp.]